MNKWRFPQGFLFCFNTGEKYEVKDDIFYLGLFYT